MAYINTKKRADGTPYKEVSYRGGWLLTSLTDKTLEPADDVGI